LDATAETLRVDGKNYHAWAHRQWALNRFKAWSRELPFVDSELAKDVRNNSAWNQRYCTIRHLHGDDIPDAVRISELKYAQAAISRAPNNESAWSYARGLYRDRSYTAWPDLEIWCLTQRTAWPTCAHLLGTLVDIGEEAVSTPEASGSNERVQRAIEACASLASGIDDVHAKFWRRRRHRLLQALQKKEGV
jgi:protein farnesyltransferase/geranylgeranyltransferase type-1 subunit alpha